MSIISYKVEQALGDKLQVGEIIQLDETQAEGLVSAGILVPATAEDLNGGGEEVEDVEAPEMVSNAAKELAGKFETAVEQATKRISEKLLKQSVSAPAPVQYHVKGSDESRTWGFKSLGDFVKAAVARQSGDISASRRFEFAQKAYSNARSKDAYSTGGGPTISNSGGSVLIPPEYASSLFERVKNLTNLFDHCTDYPFANTTEIPVDNETSYNSGVRAYWQTEDTSVTMQKPVLSTVELKAKTLMAFVPVTEQLLQDNAYTLDTWLGRKVPTKMIHRKNANLLYADGGGAGVISHAATIAVTRETANRITFKDVSGMFSRMHSDNLDNAKWYVSPTQILELLKLSFPDASGSFPLYVPTPGGYPNVSGAIAGSLYGKPVVLCDAMQPHGKIGDIMFADLSAVAKIENSVDAANSIHFYFDKYSNLFRFAQRCNTISQWLGAYTRMDGTTASPFVVLSGGSTVVPTFD